MEEFPYSLPKTSERTLEEVPLFAIPLYQRTFGSGTAVTKRLFQIKRRQTKAVPIFQGTVPDCPGTFREFPCRSSYRGWERRTARGSANQENPGPKTEKKGII